MKTASITVAQGSTTYSEAPATRVYALKTLITGIKLEATGMKLTRGASCLSRAKAITGLRTNDRQKQTEALMAKIRELMQDVALVEQ